MHLGGGGGATCLVGVGGLEDVAGHLRFWVVRLRLDQVGEVSEVVAIVDEARDVLRLVLEDEHGVRGRGGGGGGGWAVGRDAPQVRRAQQEQHFPGRHRAGLWLLAAPSDLRHEPRQHGQRGAPVQARPAHVPQLEALLRRLAGCRLGCGLQGVRERLAAAAGTWRRLHEARRKEPPQGPTKQYKEDPRLPRSRRPGGL